MLKKRTIAALVLIFYLFTLAAPAASVAADAGAVAAAAAALTGHGLGGAADSPGDTTASEGASDSGIFNGDTGAKTSATPQTTDFPATIDPSASEPQTTVVNEKLEEERLHNPATMSAPAATTSISSPIDPREASGSTMYDNLRGRLARFGADFFASRRANTLTYAPVGPNYVVAPGDEVRITLWGYDDIRANLVVDRDGVLTLPKAGPLNAAGMTFA